MRAEAKFGVSLKARKDFIKQTASAAIEEKGAPAAMKVSTPLACAWPLWQLLFMSLGRRGCINAGGRG